MTDMLVTLSGSLADALSDHILGQRLVQSVDFDAAFFTLPHNYGLPPPAWEQKESTISVSKCVDFGKAQLIPGAVPHACTLLDAISLEGGPAYNELEKVVNNWLSMFCLENGYQNFGQELTQPPTNPPLNI
jgi:hypothetical protein